MKYIIELIGGDGCRKFVKCFLNTLAGPQITNAELAMKFGSKEEAEKWGKAYLPGYNYEVKEQ